MQAVDPGPLAPKFSRTSIDSLAESARCPGRTLLVNVVAANVEVCNGALEDAKYNLFGLLPTYTRRRVQNVDCFWICLDTPYRFQRKI